MRTHALNLKMARDQVERLDSQDDEHKCQNTISANENQVRYLRVTILVSDDTLKLANASRNGQPLQISHSKGMARCRTIAIVTATPTDDGRMERRRTLRPAEPSIVASIGSNLCYTKEKFRSRVCWSNDAKKPQKNTGKFSAPKADFRRSRMAYIVVKDMN
jgi:hypothetical protein